MDTSFETESYYSTDRTCFIDETTLDILRDTFYNVPTSDLNVVLLMNIYDLKSVNPSHPDPENDPDAPTDVIFFCIRFIISNRYQPIGGLLTYADRDQSDVIAECIKGCLQDLYEMGVNVLCSVSPHYKIFKNVVRKLNPDQNYDEVPDVILYKGYPNVQIIHLYDSELLINKFNRIFMERDIKFKTKTEAPNEHLALWADVFYTLNECSDYHIFLKFFYSKGSCPRQIHFFSQTIWLQYMEFKKQGVLSAHSDGAAIIMSIINTFMGFFSADSKMADKFVACWEDIIYTFQNLEFVRPKLANISREMLDMMNNCKKTLRLNSIENQLNHSSDKRLSKKKKKSNSAQPLNENVKKTGVRVKNNTDQGVNENIQDDDEDMSKQTECKLNTYKFDEVELPAAINRPLDEIPDQTENEPDAGKKSKSKKKKKKKSQKNDQSGKPELDDVDKLLLELLQHHDKYTNLEKQWDFLNKFKKIRLTTKITAGPDGEFSNLPCINGREVYWEEKLDIDVEQELVAKEVLCTVKGIAELITMLFTNNIMKLKADSLLIQPLDELVTQIQKNFNKMKLVYYFGRCYQCMDLELIKYTLDKTQSLYLAVKD